MNLFQVPWVEVALIVPVLGALIVSRFRNPTTAFQWGLCFSGASFLCSLLACIGYYAGLQHDLVRWEVFPRTHDRPLFSLDELSAPLLPLTTLLHFLTILSTARTKMERFSFTWSLAAEAVQLAVFACREPWALIGFLALGTLPPYVVLLAREKPTRVYVLHMALFVGLMVTGWLFVDTDTGPQDQAAWATLPLLAAILIRCGAVPLHCWVTDLFEHASFGSALLFMVPLTGVYAATRLVLPIAPGWVLQGLGLFSLVTAVYAAGMSLVQIEARRFFAYLFLSHSSLVLVGVELVGMEHHPVISLTGSLCLWIAVSLSLGGFGITLRALEARFGRLSLSRFHGLYDHSPGLAVCFLLTGLASVGFPGTLGYVAAEVLMDGAIEANLAVGIALIAAATLNGISVVRAYFLLFTGTRHTSTVSLNLGTRERIAVLTLAALILGGGLFPQANVYSRHRAAEQILRNRARHVVPNGEPIDTPVDEPEIGPNTSTHQ